MNAFQTIIAICLFGNAAIGLIVVGINPKRRLNRYYFLSTLFISLWLLCMLAVTLQLGGMLLFWTQQVSAAAVFLPLGFYILRKVIMEPDLPPMQLWFKLRYHLLAAFSTAMLCQTRFFVHSTSFSGPNRTIPVSEYGPGMYLYILYFVIMVIGMVISMRDTLRKCTGIQRLEGQFLLLGWLNGFSFGLLLFVIAILTGWQETTQFLPLFGLILDGFVAYGIATKRILSVSEVLQRVAANVLVACFLAIEYIITLRLGYIALYAVAEDALFASHFFAALVVAFSVVPAQGWMHVLSRRIIFYNKFSGDGLLARAGTMIREIPIEAGLNANFTKLIREAFGCPHAVLFRQQPDETFLQVYPNSGNPMVMYPRDALLKLLSSDRKAITTVMLERMRPTTSVADAIATLQTKGMDLAVGGFMRGKMKAVLLLHTRKSGRIYDLRDQRTLQILCDQFAVALENASLYTAVENAKIYNDILLDALTSGIVAVNMERNVTVFNQCAQRITGLSENEITNQSMDALPEAISECLSTILNTQTGFRNRDTTIQTVNGMIPIRVSGETFHSHTGQLLGALVIFTDLTEIKQMEAQIRRSDRLSSIGTLSAGMAHEIKNPLVTIKTFTQLLPDQYKDEEFRQTFFNLVGQEVKRIDTIVNRLLNFARPATATLVPLSLHDVVDGSLQLIAQQLTQNGITLERHLDAVRHRISADANQLNQAFINFLLNAVHAMKDGGTLTVRTSLHRSPPDAPSLNGWRNGYCIRLDIEDTGCGIPPENLDRIFDPFFTTKEHGVGLGLSVSHGIIGEHKGIIHVESRQNIGTLFQVSFPLA